MPKKIVIKEKKPKKTKATKTIDKGSKKSKRERQEIAKRQYQQITFALIQIAQQCAYFDIKILSKKSGTGEIDPYSINKKLQSPKAKAIWTRSKFTKGSKTLFSNYFLIYKAYYSLLVQWFNKLETQWKKIPKDASESTKEKYHSMYRSISYALSFLYRDFREEEDIQLDPKIKKKIKDNITPIRDLYRSWSDEGSKVKEIGKYVKLGLAQIKSTKGKFNLFGDVLQHNSVVNLIRPIEKYKLLIEFINLTPEQRLEVAKNGITTKLLPSINDEEVGMNIALQHLEVGFFHVKGNPTQSGYPDK